MNCSYAPAIFPEWIKNELRTFLSNEAHNFCKTTTNCHEYFYEATNGYIIYSNVERKFDIAHDNSSQLTYDFLLPTHNKFSLRMNQMCRETEAYAAKIASCIWSSVTASSYSLKDIFSSQSLHSSCIYK
jgi:hypothetical protein